LASSRGSLRARSSSVSHSCRFTSITSLAGFILNLRQQLPKVRRERISQHFLDRPIGPLVGTVLPPAGRPPHHRPVGGAITGAAIAFRIDEGLQEIDRMSIYLLPVGSDAACHLTQNVRREMRDPDPGQDEIAWIIGDEADVTTPC